MSFDLRRRRGRARQFALADARLSAAHAWQVFAPKKGMCFSQHDMTADNGSGATVRADYNLALKALASMSSGATEPATTYAYQEWADTTSGTLKQRNAANTNWLVRRSLAETIVVSRSSNTIIAAGDFGKVFNCTSTFTQTLTAAATLGDGFYFTIRNNSTGVITIDPNSTETIDGATTITVQPGEAFTVWCTGSAFITVGRAPRASDTVAGLVEIAAQAEQETGTDVTRAVTPGRQHHHPSAAKFWAYFDGSLAGPITPSADFNVVDVTDNGTGNYTVNVDADFSSANWAGVVSGTQVFNWIGTVGAGTVQTLHRNSSDVASNSTVSVVGFGDQ